MTRSKKRWAPVVLVAFTMLAVGLAGCVGGSGGGQGPADTDAPGTGPGVDPGSQVDTGTGQDNATEAGQREHVHNLWFKGHDPQQAPIEKITLFDGTVTLESVSPNQTQGQSPIVNFNCPDTRSTLCMGSKWFEPQDWPSGQGKVVPPGTGQIEVTVSWNGPYNGMDVFYLHRQLQDRSDPASVGDTPFESGETRSINVGVTQADGGHAKASVWEFGVQPYGNPAGAAPDILSAGDGEVQVKIVAFRGNGSLPFEPPHPPFWTDDTPPTSTYQVGYLQDEVTQFTQAYFVEADADATPPHDLANPFDPQGLVWFIRPGETAGRESVSSGGETIGLEYAKDMVPPKAQKLVFELQADGSGLPGPLAPEVCTYVGEDPLWLQAWWSRKLVGCQPLETGTTLTMETALANDETDSVYTGLGKNYTASRFTFIVQIRPPTVNGFVHSVQSYSGSVEAGVFVTQNTTWAGTPTWSNVAWS